MSAGLMGASQELGSLVRGAAVTASIHLIVS